MSKRLVSIGSAVELCPLKDFSPLPKDVNIEELWQLIGPTVDANMQRLPLWKVFAICYYNGLQHGVSGLAALQKKEAGGDPEK